MHFSIHKFKQDGVYIVLDINSGGVHVCDETTYKMLDYLEPPLSEDCPAAVFNGMPEYSAEELNECYSELLELYKEGVLFSSDDYKKYAETEIKAPVKALCLHVAHDCNLRCGYCFAATGDFGTGRELMALKTGRKAIDFLIKNSGQRKELELDFFGGEPLMAWDTVTETVKYAREQEKKHNKQFNFTLTTNGILLDDEKSDFINNEMSNIVLSLDGRREVNDRMRPAANGKGSYDIILPKFKKLIAGRNKENRTDYYIRGTFTAYNLDFADDVLSMADEGFEQLSVEPAVSGGIEPYAIREEHIPRILDEYDRLFDIMKNRKRSFNFFHFNIDLNQGPCVLKRLRGCGAGNEYLAVTPNGNIFPCHQFVGIEQWNLGNINIPENEINKPEIKNYFSNTHIYSKKDCSECWAKFYCSGGCNAAGFLYEDDVRKPHRISCELMKKRTECAIALSCAKS